MNNKGFTLIELLAVITLLAIIGGIATISVTAIGQNIRENMLNKKIEMIEEAAILYGSNNLESIINSSKQYSGYPCISIIISNLVPDYIDKDNNNACLTSSSTSTVGCVVNPKDKEKYLDKKKVIIYYKNKVIHAMVDTDNNLTCS